MFALVLCSILIAFSQVFALQQVLAQPAAPSPMTSLFPPMDYQRSLNRQDLALLGIHDYEIGKLKTNSDCPNSEKLQYILSLLKRLLIQDESSLTNANFGKVNEKLQFLAWLKNFLEYPEQQNDSGSSEEEPQSNVVLSNESPKTRVEAQFVLKYEIPNEPGIQHRNTGCQQALTRIIQTINNAQLQLINYCRRAENCILQEPATNINFSKLPRSLNDILGSIRSMQNAQIRSKSPSDENFPSSNDQELPENYLEPSRYDLLPNMNSETISHPRMDYESTNRKDSKYETLTHFPDLMRQLTKQKNSQDAIADMERRTPKMAIHKHLPEELYIKDRNKPSPPFSDDPENYKLNRPQNFDLDNRYQSVDDRYTSAPVSYQSQEDIYKKASNIIGKYNKPLPPSPNQNSILYTLPKNNRLNFGKDPVYPIPKQKTVLSPVSERMKSMLTDKYSVLSNNLQYKLKNKFVNENSNPESYVNTYTPFYSDDYHKQRVYGNKLFDSPQLTSIPNLGKLNFAADNNGMVELTYTLRQPQTYQPYYYVKYQLPYNDFVSKILELSKNPELRQNPQRLHEELLSVSNVVDTSPNLRTVENSELSKLVLKSGALVHASVLSGRSSETDELLRTVQNLNSKLKTSEILNLVSREPKGTSKLRDGSDFSNYDSLHLNDLEPERPIHFFSDLITNKNARTFVAQPFSFAPSTYPRPT